MAAGKKNATRLGAHIVFVDESGFLLIPPVRKTWAPRGKTPILRHHQRRDRISAISGLSVSPKRKRLGLYYQLHDKNIQQAEVCTFVRHLLRHLRGHVILIWDNGTPHKGDPIRELLRRFPRLHIERFPAYAPELIPDEGVWCSLKKVLPTDAQMIKTNSGNTSWTNSTICATINLPFERASTDPTFPLFCREYCINYADINNRCRRRAEGY